MRIALAGAGAFGIKHLDALAQIDGVTVTSIVSRRLEQAEEVAAQYGAVHASTDLDDALARDDVDAVILCTPTQMHAQQAIELLSSSPIGGRALDEQAQFVVLRRQFGELLALIAPRSPPFADTEERSVDRIADLFATADDRAPG